MQTNNKILSCLTLLAMLLFCRSSKELVVKLSPNYNLSSEMGQTSWITTDITGESSLSTYAQQLELDEYIITRFLHKPWEHYYFEWKEGKRDFASFAAMVNRYNDSIHPPANLPKVDGESLFLFGRKKTGEYIVMRTKTTTILLLMTP